MLFRQPLNAELKRYWPTIAVSAICLFLIFGVPSASLPFLYKSVIEEFNWTREQATMLGSVHWLSGALISLSIGRIVERVGALRVIVATALLSGISMLSFRFAGSTVDYYLAGVGLGLSGFGMVTSVQVFISHIFTERQGTAVGLALVGNSMAGVLLPLVLAPALETFAWDDVMAVLGAISVAVVLPISVIILRNRDFSLRKHAVADQNPAKTVGKVWRDRRFWFVAASLFLVAMVDGGLIQHTVLYLQIDKAIHYTVVGLAISSYHLASMASRVVFGRVLDRFSVNGVIVGYLLVAASALLAFGVQGFITAIFFALVRGLAHGGLIVTAPILARHVFGREELGQIIGFLVALTTTGLAVGTIVLARLYDMTGSYTFGLVVFCLIPVAAALLLVPLSSQPRRVDSLPA